MDSGTKRGRPPIAATCPIGFLRVTEQSRDFLERIASERNLSTTAAARLVIDEAAARRRSHDRKKATP